jgi:hypothetical protein
MSCWIWPGHHELTGCLSTSRWTTQSHARRTWCVAFALRSVALWLRAAASASYYLDHACLLALTGRLHLYIASTVLVIPVLSCVFRFSRS